MAGVDLVGGEKMDWVSLEEQNMKKNNVIIMALK